MTHTFEDMEETMEDWASLGSDIWENGIEVHINIGPKEVIEVVAIATIVSTFTWVALSTLNVAAKRALIKMRENEEEK